MRNCFLPRQSHRAACAAVAVCSLAVSSDLRAVENRFAVNAGVGYSDNITLVDTGKKSETMASFGVDASMSGRTRRLTSYLGINASYVEYLDNSYDSEVVGSAVANFNLSLLPERFEWYLNDNFGQLAMSQGDADTPDNREYVNVASTGPVFKIRLGSSNQLQLIGEYTRVDYEVSPFDNDSLGGSVALIHSFSEGSSLTARVEQRAIEFSEQPGSSDFDRTNATLSYSMDNARMRMHLEGGGVEIKRDAGDDQTGSIIRATVSRVISPASFIELAVGRELADASDLFIQSATTAGDTSALSATNSPITSKFAKLTWGFYRGRTGFALSANHYRYRYKLETLSDLNRTEYSAIARRQLSPRLGGFLSGSYWDEELIDTAVNFNQKSLSTGLDWSLGSRLSMSFDYQHVRRNSRDTSVGGYRENRAWLRLYYGSRQEASEQFLPSY